MIRVIAVRVTGDRRLMCAARSGETLTEDGLSTPVRTVRLPGVDSECTPSADGQDAQGHDGASPWNEIGPFHFPVASVVFIFEGSRRLFAGTLPRAVSDESYSSDHAGRMPRCVRSHTEDVSVPTNFLSPTSMSASW